MWELIEEEGLKYFQFKYQDDIFLYSIKQGADNFLKRFDPIFLKQIHSDVIIDVDSSPARIGDGLVTRTNQAIGVKVADCLPVYLFSKEKICILHCGWRSIIKGIINKATKVIKDYKYCLGASIGPCCYEIKEDVAKLFRNEYPDVLIYKNHKIFLDLKIVVNHQLDKKNLIGDLNYCTKCHPEYFYSYRRGDTNKRNYAVILRTY